MSKAAGMDDEPAIPGVVRWIADEVTAVVQVETGVLRRTIGAGPTGSRPSPVC
jgi:hypothetical protein